MGYTIWDMGYGDMGMGIGDWGLRIAATTLPDEWVLRLTLMRQSSRSQAGCRCVEAINCF